MSSTSSPWSREYYFVFTWARERNSQFGQSSRMVSFFISFFLLRGKCIVCSWCMQAMQRLDKPANDIANKRWKIYCFFVSNRMLRRKETFCETKNEMYMKDFQSLQQHLKWTKEILMAWIYLHFKSFCCSFMKGSRFVSREHRKWILSLLFSFGGVYMLCHKLRGFIGLSNFSDASSLLKLEY